MDILWVASTGLEQKNLGTWGEFYGTSYFVNPRGQIISEASRDQDELLVAEFDLDLIDEVRSTWQFFRDRRPETYDKLVEL